MTEAGKQTKAIGVRGFLLRTFADDGNDNIVFRVYEPDHSFVDYEITNYDCEIVIIDPDAALFRTDAGDFLDYTAESMGVSKNNSK